MSFGLVITIAELRKTLIFLFLLIVTARIVIMNGQPMKAMPLGDVSRILRLMVNVQSTRLVIRLSGVIPSFIRS